MHLAELIARSLLVEMASSIVKKIVILDPLRTVMLQTVSAEPTAKLRDVATELLILVKNVTTEKEICWEVVVISVAPNVVMASLKVTRCATLETSTAIPLLTPAGKIASYLTVVTALSILERNVMPVKASRQPPLMGVALVVYLLGVVMGLSIQAMVSSVMMVTKILTLPFLDVLLIVSSTNFAKVLFSETESSI